MPQTGMTLKRFPELDSRIKAPRHKLIICEADVQYMNTMCVPCNAHALSTQAARTKALLLLCTHMAITLDTSITDVIL